jgi:biotin carboxyl carrier protein
LVSACYASESDARALSATAGCLHPRPPGIRTFLSPFRGHFMSVELKIPSVGESITEALIAQWFKSEGDTVEKDEPIAELETDKVTVELPAPVAGVLVSISRQEGETVSV